MKVRDLKKLVNGLKYDDSEVCIDDYTYFEGSSYIEIIEEQTGLTTIHTTTCKDDESTHVLSF